MKRSQNRIIETMPQEFETLADVRQFWQIIMNRNYHFNKSIQQLDLQRIQEQRLDTPWEDSANMQDGEMLLGNASTERPWPLKEEQSLYRNDIDIWSATFAPLYSRILLGTKKREQVAAAILKVQTQINHIMLAGTPFTTESAYDQFLPNFQSIVLLSSIIIPYLSPAATASEPKFQFDIGIVAALFLVGSRCRNEDKTRVRAIEMLLGCRLREGIWDSLSVGHMARWIRSLEV